MIIGFQYFPSYRLTGKYFSMTFETASVLFDHYFYPRNVPYETFNIEFCPVKAIRGLTIECPVRDISWVEKGRGLGRRSSGTLRATLELTGIKYFQIVKFSDQIISLFMKLHSM